MNRWNRGLSRPISNSSESNVLSSLLYTKNRFHGSNPIKVDKSKPYTQQQNPSSLCRTRKDFGLNDDFVHMFRSCSSPSYERKELPEKLAKRVMKLTCESTAEGGVCDVYVIGVTHISKESCQAVQAVISFLKPQVAFLELCSSRVHRLKPQNLKVPPPPPTMREMVVMWMRGQNLFIIIYHWLNAKDAFEKQVVPESGVRVGFVEAMKYGGKVILGDRPIDVHVIYVI